MGWKKETMTTSPISISKRALHRRNYTLANLTTTTTSVATLAETGERHYLSIAT